LVHRDVNHVDPAIDSFYRAVYGNQSIPVWTPHSPDHDQGLVLQNPSPPFAVWGNLYLDQCDELWDPTIPVPTIIRRLTPCVHDECSVNASHHVNVCVDNYNGTYYCQCASGWKPSANDTACIPDDHRTYGKPDFIIYANRNDLAAVAAAAGPVAQTQDNENINHGMFYDLFRNPFILSLLIVVGMAMMLFTFALVRHRSLHRPQIIDLTSRLM